MKIKQQFIGKDKYKNLQLLVETEDKEYFILRYTNELGFDKITEETFLKYIKSAENK